MPRPPRAASAEVKPAPQRPHDVAAAIERFLAAHPEALALEDGKVAFDFTKARCTVSTEHDRCTVHLWSEERNAVRTVVSCEERNGSLRLATQRLGQKGTKLLELAASRERRTLTARETARKNFVPVMERVLGRAFPEWAPAGFRAAMELEKSFGPAYARGSLMRGSQAWAVIAVSAAETPVTVDGILTLGILWLQHCREQAAGRRLYAGLKVVVPRGMAMLTLARMAWLNPAAAQWELWELDQASEELTPRDLADQGNLRTRLVHHPDPAAAAERFADAVAAVRSLVPEGEWERVEQRLRSTAELAFLLHGLEFARARLSPAPGSFAHVLELTVGAGKEALPLTPATREQIAQHVAELFARRRVVTARVDFGRRGMVASRRIGQRTPEPAHSRMQTTMNSRVAGNAAQSDPLYRAVPERWLESVLRRDLAPLTRGLAAVNDAGGERRAALPGQTSSPQSTTAAEEDPDTIGNRVDPKEDETRSEGRAQRWAWAHDADSRVIPRLAPEHVYAQVPAIAGASDRGLLDLLGVTADGRLAVIELKAEEDLHFALQGLDYWIRVRHHHLSHEGAGAAPGDGSQSEFQRHGYFRGVLLSPLPPRLYLVAPALRIHPATEVVLRYFSPRVEWQLLALDERWRERVRVVWRRSGGEARGGEAECEDAARLSASNGR